MRRNSFLSAGLSSGRSEEPCLEAYGLKKQCNFLILRRFLSFYEDSLTKKEFAGGPKNLKRSKAYWKHILLVVLVRFWHRFQPLNSSFGEICRSGVSRKRIAISCGTDLGTETGPNAPHPPRMTNSSVLGPFKRLSPDAHSPFASRSKLADVLW